MYRDCTYIEMCTREGLSFFCKFSNCPCVYIDRLVICFRVSMQTFVPEMHNLQYIQAIINSQTLVIFRAKSLSNLGRYYHYQCTQ